MRLAVWSGPRNLSTAMMYAFANRRDTNAWDEPFYAPYLSATGLDHPMADDIIAAHEADPAIVAAACAKLPAEGRVHYMKHMPHHMLEGFDLGWAEGCTHVHLIRHPARVIASYGAKRREMTFDDIGYAQQLRIFDRVGGCVVDTSEIRADPEGMLRSLCEAVGLPFDPAMLAWPEGPRAFDGIWAAHWYGSVHQSTGFAGPEGPLPELDGAAADLLSSALPLYDRLFKRRLKKVSEA